MLLSALVLVPILAGLAVLFIPNDKITRIVSLVLSLGHFAISLGLLLKFNKSTVNYQFAESYEWIPFFGTKLSLGVDGISLWLVILTSFFIPIVILASWSAIESRVRFFHSQLFFLLSAMTGTFLALDAVLFYVFFEASLVPMYFLIGIWGGARKLYATMKFFLYTMLGSVLMLASIIYLMLLCQDQLGHMSSSLIDFYRLKIPFVGGELLNPQTLMFFAFATAFAIKVPLFPLHTWLPDAHVEAPTPGSVILAAIMLKMGTYGFLRFVLPLFPEATQYWAWLLMFLGVAGIIYGALTAMVQPDVKKLVAYSSVSHMGYIVAGIFALNVNGIVGATYQMLNHGISTGALFLLVGMIYERTHSREISRYGGLASVMPHFTVAFFIVTLSSIAVPGTNGFVGEFLILLGVFTSRPVYGVVAVLGVILGAVYMLWMFKRIFLGPKGELVKDEEHPLKDINLREWTVLSPLIVLIFWMGVFPNHFLDYSKSSLEHLSNNLHNYHIEMGTEDGGGK
ncbi:MAG: Fe-S-binding domain-containing protein [Bdellovibrionales bacterium CG10_big_fil_rev_8_21_14_0_10_45_34]|nr:MAG: Fe-S-binding domain-containing protein [Bdellovibrionales bacterium CG10_big_fil_rev_8_21_14_0_10_45_34]